MGGRTMTVQVQKSYSGDEGAGKLYLVATPIGNLEDMTFRAVRILQEADMIAAEDTRQTRKLLTHYEIHTRVVSYHEHNKHASGPELVRLMKDEGVTIALVTDAGTPAVSDPGYDLAKLAMEQDITVVPIPGANAAVSALIVSGLPTERFTFVGFPPRGNKEMREWLDALQASAGTLILYESPHRVIKTLERMKDGLGNRQVALVRELTKRHEEAVRGSIDDCLQYLQKKEPLGEYCIIVEGRSIDESGGVDGEGAWWSGLTVHQHVDHYEEQGLNRKEAMKKAAVDRGVSKREIYAELLE